MRREKRAHLEKNKKTAVDNIKSLLRTICVLIDQCTSCEFLVLATESGI